jgi:glucose-1-phosphate cytidylyltransferase
VETQQGGHVDVGHTIAVGEQKSLAAHGKIATVTAVRPPARFGGLVFDGDRVAEFTEKPQVGEGWINGGFMVFEPAVFEWLGGDDCVLEADTLEALAAAGELYAYRHEGFWQCVDTVREKRLLEELWQKGAPWKRWG